MPILDLQKRMRQLGEIRIGHVVPTSNGKSRPEKLNKFRFTSPSREILAGIATEYGGEVKPWTPANGGPEEFEVYTTVNRLPVVIPPLAVTQWYELYQGSKCVRRCDSVLEQKSDRACMCDPEKRDCAITTRLNVMMRDVGPIGYWLLTSRGYYAAVELPPIAELLAKGGGNVPGWLGLEERREVHEKPGGGTETRRFMVPTLDIDLTPAQILSGRSVPTALAAGETHQQIADAGRPQITAGPASATGDPYAPFHAQLVSAATAADCMAIFAAARDAGLLGEGSPETPEREQLFNAIGERGRALSAALATAGPVSDEDPDALWQSILTAAGSLDMTVSQIEADFAAANGGTSPETASAGELRVFLDGLKARAA